jgi:hypothetical protein
MLPDVTQGGAKVENLAAEQVAADTSLVCAALRRQSAEAVAIADPKGKQAKSGAPLSTTCPQALAPLALM